MRKKKPLPILENITVTGFASEGKSICKNDGMVIFVPFTAPGDQIDIQVTKNRRRYMEGKAVNFHSYSTMRTEPFCEHFGICGGCKWQHIQYNDQLNFKQEVVTDHFSRIAMVDYPEPEPILGSVKERGYRNKLEFTFTNRRWLTDEEIKQEGKINDIKAIGFHVPGRFDKVLDINRCHLQPEPSNAIRETIKEYALKNQLDFFDLVKQEGFLRTLIIRNSIYGELMVIVVFFRENSEERIKLLEHVRESFPEITSLMYIINSKANDSISDQEVILYAGRDHIIEMMGNLRFKVGPKSFYQTNSLQAHELYKIVLDFAAPSGNDIIFDLYTGTGTIASFLSGHCKSVTGIEYLPEAIDDANYNSRLNNLNNLRFYAGDIKDLMNDELVRTNGKPDIVITDPPRTGMHPAVIEQLINLSPGRIVYVSCNSATQARDIGLLNGSYKITRMRAVDMFPHTQHVENVVLLERR